MGKVRTGRAANRRATSAPTAWQRRDRHRHTKERRTPHLSDPFGQQAEVQPEEAALLPRRVRYRASENPLREVVRRIQYAPILHTLRRSRHDVRLPRPIPRGRSPSGPSSKRRSSHSRSQAPEFSGRRNQGVNEVVGRRPRRGQVPEMPFGRCRRREPAVVRWACSGRLRSRREPERGRSPRAARWEWRPLRQGCLAPRPGG